MDRYDWGEKLVPYPPEAVERYRAAGAWGTLTIAGELRERAERFGDRLAVVAVDGRLTYEELDREADRVAAGLYNLGLVQGERVIFQLTNSIPAVLAWYGCLKAGLIPVCTLVQHRAHEIGQIVAQSEAAAHIVQADLPRTDLVELGRRMAKECPTLRELITVGATGEQAGTARLEALGGDVDPATARSVVNAIQGTIDPDEVAVFQLSGGTTSTPKVIPRLHAEYWYNARAYAEFWGWGKDDRIAHLIPIIHNAGIVCGVHGPHSVGACAVVGVPDAALLTPLVAETEPTDMIMNLALFDLVMANPDLREALRSLKRLMFSGSKLPQAVIDEFETADCPIVQCFGMGEGLFMQTPATASAAMRHHTVGVPLSELDEVRIVDAAGAPLPAGEAGELRCRGPYTLHGYYDAADRNREAFTADGFYRTGDIAAEQVIDGVSAYAIEGRIKDVINRGGEKVNVEEIERMMIEHPRIRLAAVVAMPDPRLGERACAYVVLEGDSDAGLELTELTDYLNEHEVAKFKWPERLEVIDDLPRTNVGKIDKKALRADVASKLDASVGELTKR